MRVRVQRSRNNCAQGGEPGNEANMLACLQEFATFCWYGHVHMIGARVSEHPPVEPMVALSRYIDLLCNSYSILRRANKPLHLFISPRGAISV